MNGAVATAVEALSFAPNLDYQGQRNIRLTLTAFHGFA